jgi:predicted XRE-type DNA-binding protein
MDKSDTQKIISELEALKKLAILQLLEKGYSQTQIALALGIGQATVSRMFPSGALKKKGKPVVTMSVSASDVEPNAA